MLSANLYAPVFIALLILVLLPSVLLLPAASAALHQLFVAFAIALPARHAGA